MDFSTVIGLIVGIGLIAWAILHGQNSHLFLDKASLAIVVGGTLGVTFIKNPLNRVLSTIAVVRKAFFTKLPLPEQQIEQLVDLARRARKESLLALERADVTDPFLVRAIRLTCDGMEPVAMKAVLETELGALVQRHRRGQELLEGIAASAPAFGMIGTLIGLAQMLSSMDDPIKIGPAMAVALMTTLYGALIANLFALPLAEKLKNRSREELASKTLVVQGMVMIAEGEHPLAVEEKLAAYLAPKVRREPQVV